MTMELSNDMAKIVLRLGTIKRIKATEFFYKLRFALQVLKLKDFASLRLNEIALWILRNQK